MKRFATLFDELDTSTATNAKVAALCRYLAEVDDADAAWAVYLLSGGKPRQLIKTAQLRAQAIAEAGLPEWLFEASYQAVGDLAETIALVLPAPAQDSGMHTRLSDWMEQRLLPLRGQPDEVVAEALRGWWRELDAGGRFLLVKLVGGGFRVGVSKLLVQRALAAHAGLDAKQVAARMMGFTDSKRTPTAAAYRALIAPAQPSALSADRSPRRRASSARNRSSSISRSRSASCCSVERRSRGRASGAGAGGVAHGANCGVRVGSERGAYSRPSANQRIVPSIGRRITMNTHVTFGRCRT